ILDLLARRGKQLPGLVEELFEKVGPHYYDRIDITMSAEARAQVEDRLRFLEPTSISGMAVTDIDRVDGLRFNLDGGGWALIRLSGTEPLMRIYTEVSREDLVQPVLDSVREMTGA
ncbi:MAG: phosphoglucomutase/phosphomannomutase family protein, partial [Dehalococcoidia bacterium]